MFTPDSDKLKTIIFHLLKKKPMSNTPIPSWKYDNKEVTIGYPYHPYVVDEKKESNNWMVNINIFNSNAPDENSYYITGADVNLTEKEAMELKWALDDIADNLKETLFNELADFALENEGTQDELIDD